MLKAKRNEEMRPTSRNTPTKLVEQPQVGRRPALGGYQVRWRQTDSGGFYNRNKYTQLQRFGF